MKFWDYRFWKIFKYIFLIYQWKIWIMGTVLPSRWPVTPNDKVWWHMISAVQIKSRESREPLQWGVKTTNHSTSNSWTQEKRVLYVFLATNKIGWATSVSCNRHCMRLFLPNTPLFHMVAVKHFFLVWLMSSKTHYSSIWLLHFLAALLFHLI